jgi:hypothetical protein
MISDINPAGDSSPRSLTGVNGMLFFSVNDGTNGRELWKLSVSEYVYLPIISKD